VVVPDEARLQEPVELEAEAAVGAGQEEVLVPAGGHAVLEQARPRVGVGQHVGHEAADLVGAALGEPVVADLRPQLVDLAGHLGLVLLEPLDPLQQLPQRWGVASRLFPEGGRPGHHETGRQRQTQPCVAAHQEVYRPEPCRTCEKEGPGGRPGPPRRPRPGDGPRPKRKTGRRPGRSEVP
jgi:hypothetical protein